MFVKLLSKTKGVEPPKELPKHEPKEGFDAEAPYLEQARRMAIEQMGDGYLLDPNYRPENHPQHRITGRI